MNEAPHECAKCGQPHLRPEGTPSCRAHVKGSGKPCKAQPVEGTGLCRVHGVNGAMRAKAAVAITETKIREKLERYGDLDDVTRADPLNGLLRRVVTADAMVRVLTEQVAELDSQAIADAAVMHLLGEWSDRHARYCKLAVDAGVDVQRLAMTQAMGQMIVALLRTLVTDLADRLGWTPDVMQVANEVVRTHLVALEAG